MAQMFGSIRGLEMVGRQRVDRSEAILAQLYRDQLDPPLRVLQNRWIKALALVSILAVLLFTGTLFYKFNSFILLREDALAKAGNLESAIQRRSNLFSNIINVALNHAALEHSVFSYTSKMRTEIIKKSGLPEALADSLMARAGSGTPGGKGDNRLPSEWGKSLETLFKAGDMDTSLGKLLAVVEQYPNIQSAKTYQQLMSSLVEMEDLIAGRRVEYNLALREYNTAISKFPWQILAKATEFGRLEYFAAGSGDAAAPVITPAMFSVLVPSTMEEKAPER